MAERWIQHANIRRGALHRQLGYPMTQNIPLPALQRIQKQATGTHVRTPKGSLTITTKMKRRANFALNIR
jgi:hypothetical protein